ncbi:MAG: hypothetical protein PWQ84_879 [Thermotogaceae bacterium]|nr:hypothetical protein [Thermotogaceae bacterium]
MMRISFSTAALYPRLSIDALKLLSDCGLKEAELMPQCYYETTVNFAKEVSNLNIKVSSIHFPLCLFSVLYNPYPGMVQEAKELIDNLIQAGSIMGTEIVVIHPFPKMEEVKHALFLQPVKENFRYLASKAQEKGITIALENNPNSLGKTPEGLNKEVTDIAHDNIKPMVDTTEAWEAGIEPEPFISKTKPIHLHLSDYKGDRKHLSLGKGDGDWKNIIKTIQSLDYKGIYVIEPAYKFYLEDAKHKIVQDKIFLESL